MARDPDGPSRDPNERGPKHRVVEGDHLWYVHPLTGERFVSVTSALEMARKEDLDLRWRPSLTAAGAFRELPRVIAATLTPDCGQTYGRCSRSNTRQHDWRERCTDCPCEQCPRCVQKYLTYEHYRESARHVRRGSFTHHWIEDYILLGFDAAKTWAKFADDTRRQILRATGREATAEEVEEAKDLITPYVDGFLRFGDDFGLQPSQWLMAEATVLNREHGFGGTIDAQVQFHAADSPKSLELCERLGLEHPVVNYDAKTRERDESAFWFDHALQQAPYRRGEVVLLDDGSERPLPAVDGAVIVQLMPNKYAWRLVVTDQAAYNAFLGILQFAKWMIESSNASTLVKTFPRQELPGASKPKRAPRKAAAKPVAPPVDQPVAVGRVVVDVPLPVSAPQRVRAPDGAIMESMLGSHPDSPYDDGIPF